MKNGTQMSSSIFAMGSFAASRFICYANYPIYFESIATTISLDRPNAWRRSQRTGNDSIWKLNCFEHETRKRALEYRGGASPHVHKFVLRFEGNLRSSSLCFILRFIFRLLIKRFSLLNFLSFSCRSEATVSLQEHTIRYNSSMSFIVHFIVANKHTVAHQAHQLNFEVPVSGARDVLATDTQMQ